MSKNSLFSIIVVLIISACSSVVKKEYTNADGNNVFEEWYNKTSLKSRTTFLSQDSSEYIFISFYEDGEMKDSSRYVNNIVDGLRMFYDKPGDLLHVENYTKGVLNGPHKALYSTGISSFEGYRLNDNMVGEWKFHYPDGRPITYEFYDSTGKVLYFRKYNESGVFASSNGSAIIGVSIVPNLNSSDTIFVNLLIANPSSCEFEVIISDDHFKELYKQKINTVNPICPLTYFEPGKKVLDIQLTILDVKSGHEEKHLKNFEFILQ